eukprot:contig_375_g12
MSALARTAAAVGRATVRRASNAAAPAGDAAAARPAPRLPEGVDPAALHPKAHAVADMWRWRLGTGVASVPVFGYFCLQMMADHPHPAPGPAYPFMQITSRVPRFPWGDENFIGTPYERQHKGDH